MGSVDLVDHAGNPSDNTLVCPSVRECRLSGSRVEGSGGPCKRMVLMRGPTTHGRHEGSDDDLDRLIDIDRRYALGHDDSTQIPFGLSPAAHR